LLLTACGQNQNSKSNTDTTVNATSSVNGDTGIIQTAKDAYINGIPLVITDLKGRQITDPAMGGDLFAPPKCV
jgi:hypothetical protein